MKITAISNEEYRWPRHKPITNGKHTYTHAGLALVKIETDSGETGIGLGGGGAIGRVVDDRRVEAALLPSSEHPWLRVERTLSPQGCTDGFRAVE